MGKVSSAKKTTRKTAKKAAKATTKGTKKAAKATTKGTNKAAKATTKATKRVAREIDPVEVAIGVGTAIATKNPRAAGVPVATAANRAADKRK